MTVFGDLTRAMSSIVLTTFGEPVVFHLEGQAEALPGRGVFSAAHQEVDASTGVPVSIHGLIAYSTAKCVGRVITWCRGRATRSGRQPGFGVAILTTSVIVIIRW